MVFKILHNPNCSKSRAALELLKSSKFTVDVVNYQENPLNKTEISQLLKALKMHAIEIIRTNEPVWIESRLTEDSPEAEIIEAMIINPCLIERPIIVHGDNAVIGRPVENVKKILGSVS